MKLTIINLESDLSVLIQVLTITLVFICVSSCRSRFEPKVWSSDERIIDGAELLTRQEIDSLFVMINDLSINLGPQIGVVTTDSLSGVDERTFCLQNAEDMQLGRSSYADGIIIFISVKDGATGIMSGKGLVQVLPSEKLKWIDQVLLKPRVKEKEYFEGLNDAISFLKRELEEKKELIGKFPNDQQ
ncbi:MAG: TPM domain-containing protein [Cytophagales bacterium]